MKYYLLISFFCISIKLNSQNIIQLEKDRFELDTFLSALSYNFSLQDSLYNSNRNNFNINLSQHLVYAYENNNYAHQTGVQFNFFVTYQNYLDFHLHYKVGLSNTNFVPYESNLQSKSYFFHAIDSNYGFFQDLRFRWIVRANKFIQLHFGIDKNKIGEGSRSLFVGNDGIPYPFILLKTSFWKFEYLYLHQVFREGIVNHYIPKGNTQHLLQFNWNKKLSLAIFENVGYLMKDTLYNRGLEWEYWNPVIFFRPQEYSLGSSDNVNLGLQIVYRFKKNIFYSQFLMDDFLLAEIKARSRWQHNKYAFQLGFKKEFNIKKRDIFWRIETTLIRPYTFSHKNFNTSYSNQGLPIAHPLGSNFVELYNELYVSGKWMNFYFFTQFYMKGNDIKGSNISYGGDVLKSYGDKPVGQTYGFYIGNGEKTYRLQVGTRIEKNVILKRFTAFIEPRIILEKRTPKIVNKYYITIGIISKFNQDNRNY